MSTYLMKRRLEAYERLYEQAQETMAVLALADLGVFEALRAGPMTAAELAKKTGAVERRLGPFLDAVASIGFLERRNTQYALVRGDGDLLDPAGPWATQIGLGGLAGFFGDLAGTVERLRSGGRLDKAGTGAEVPDEQRHRFLRYMHARVGRAAREVAALLTEEPVDVVADLGSGAGTYAFEILRRAPRANAVLVDRPNAEPVVAELARAARVEDRAAFVGGDLFDVDFGRGFDLVLLADVLHSYGREANARLIALAADRLVSGGRVAVKDYRIDLERTGPPGGIWFAVTMAICTDEGNVYGPEEVAEWMRAAGLEPAVAHALDESPDSYLLTGRRI
jgi:trans-aconitate methyltransferase